MTFEDPARKQSVVELPSVKKQSWLRYEHPEYTRNKTRWQYVRDHYTGEVIEAGKIIAYLKQRVTGETPETYKERCDLADYTPHFSECVESLAGMISAVEGDANRTFLDENGKGLGKIDDPATPIGRLWQKAGPDGGYLTIMKNLAIELTHSHMAWLFVDPGKKESTIKVLPALMVQNWADDGSEALIIESVDTRSSLMDAPSMQTQWLHITTRGWQRYTEDKNGDPLKVGEPGVWAFESHNGTPIIPLVQVRLPMKRPIGYQQARKANVIFNKESVRDFGQRIAGFQKLVVAADDTLYAKLETAISAGANLLQEDPANAGGGHRYIGPDPAPATSLTETIKQNVADFKATFHKAYDDSAAQKTATEVRQDVGSGTGAFLQLLKAGLDDAENGALMLLEQAEFPNDRGKWFIARVERSDDFVPVDINAVQAESAKLAFGEGKAVPMGATARIALAKEIAENRGAKIDPDELDAHVRISTMIEILESAPTSGLVIPAETKADMVVMAVQAAGLLPKDAEEQMADGTKKPKRDVIRAAALKLIKAADDAKAREAEAISGGRTDDDDEIPDE